MRAAAERAWRPGRALRLDDRSRRYRRCERPGVGDVHPRRSVQAPVGPGRRPVRREAPHRGDAGADRAAASSRASRTWVPRASRVPPPRPPTAAGWAWPSTSTRSRGASPASSRSRCSISESQERMLAIVRPERWADVRAVCDRWDLPVAIIGRVTDDGDIAVAAAAAWSSRARPSARPRERGRDLHARSSGARPPAHGSRPGRARGARRHACRSGAWIRAPCCWACSGRRTSGSRAVVYEQYDTTSRRTRSPVRVVARRSSASRARRRRWSRRRTRDHAGRGPRSVARRRACRRRGGPQRLDHGRAAAGRHELPELRRSDPARGVLAAPGGGPRPRRRLPCPRPAGHRRQRLALQRGARPADRADARDRRRRAAGGRREARRSGVHAPTATRCCWSARRRPGSPGASTRARGRRRRGRSAGDRSGTRGRRPAVHPRGDRPRARRVGPGRLRRRPRRRARGGGDLGRPSGAIVRLPVGELAGGRAVRREPVAARRQRRRRGTSRRSSCSPASTACRSRSSARSAADRLRRSSSRARARPVPPRSAAAASPTRSTCRSPTCGTRGSTACPRARLG